MSFFSEPAVGSCFFQNGSQNPNRGLVGWHGPFLVASDFIWYYPPCSCPAVYPCQMLLLTPARHGAFAHPFIDEVTFFTIPLDCDLTSLKFLPCGILFHFPVSILQPLRFIVLPLGSSGIQTVFLRLLLVLAPGWSSMRGGEVQGRFMSVSSLGHEVWVKYAGSICSQVHHRHLEMSYWLDLWFSWYQLSAVIFISR